MDCGQSEKIYLVCYDLELSFEIIYILGFFLKCGLQTYYKS